MRSILKTVLSKEQSEGVGARVRRSIGSQNLLNLDPFLLLDEFKVTYPAGFPDHPHRGFETVTYMISGSFQHEDFNGTKGIIHQGDVQVILLLCILIQLVDAGRGIVHSEMPYGNQENTGLQLWVNLPMSSKGVDSKYQELLDKDIPRAQTQDGGVKVKIIAGESMNVKAKVNTHTPIFYLDFNLEPSQTFKQSIPTDYTCFIYTLSGTLSVNNQSINPHTTIVFEPVGESITFSSTDEPCRLVLIAGQKINEPIFQHGPFVMNSQQQINEAISDYHGFKNGFENAKGWKSEIGNK